MKNIQQRTIFYPGNLLLLLGGLIALSSCSKLDQNPESTVTKEAVFKSEKGLELYANSFYTMLPNADAVQRGDAMADYTARREVPDFIREGAYTARQSSGWNWSELRNINYFIENCTNTAIPADVRNNYIGIAKFFRALFYFNKVVRFGDVPWVNATYTVDEEKLYKARDPRTLVLDSMLSDLNFAITNIKATNDASRTMVTKYVALALKARIALFEGTFRKYHTNYNLVASANFWLKEAKDASARIMTEAPFKLNESGDSKTAYRNVFVSTLPNANEVILANVFDDKLSVYHDANWYWTSATYGDRASLTRTFVNTYLNIDGSSFTDNPAYKTTVFQEEVKNRDLRLSQTIRTQGYARINGGNTEVSAPLFSYTFTGYHPIKWTLDNVFYDAGSRNDNALPIFRYAEVLLVYAEAAAELGELTVADWTKTIGALRKRAGITGGLSALPTRVDPYLQQTYFPEISNPVLLEIRRERGIELVFEGLRFQDIIRWKKGKLMEQVWNGIYVPGVDQLLDLNEDSKPDVLFYNQNPANRINGVSYINVAPSATSTPNPYKLSNGSSGEITWLTNIPRVWNDKFYLYPIPESDRLINPNLGQNPGWE
ncbi:RagB/SusD family nutrient uptake outer membrane protein [Sphingobacteriaceae bacterium WQ 2009]|uniref:RagB/SusD family nutrient uptake outer membrane protein n=1 Tax=Rhinopithecimicrobium faecis TaxID=2820698 RepID=A0A8T4H9Q8_9SPHI|nr:RagB/SusD family nutrient uptake outer membrane protein [Sphingobacteriaceae bacterium WQ 2009]